MADVAAIRTGLRTRLATISGLRTPLGFDKVETPAAQVGEVEIEYDKTMGRGLDELTFKIRVYASRADDRSGQDKLDGYLKGSGSTSVKAAIEGDRTLGGTAQTLRVTGVSGYGVYEVAGMAYVGAEFTVTVWATGS
jgi:hypothetical protein